MYSDVYGLGINFCFTSLIETPSNVNPFHLSKKKRFPSHKTPFKPNVTLYTPFFILIGVRLLKPTILTLQLVTRKKIYFEHDIETYLINIITNYHY